MKVRPLSDRVLVRRVEEETMSSGGIIIPDSAREKPSAGEVVAVGEGKIENGNKISMTVKVDDKVMFGKYAGQEVKVDNEELLIMREDDIIAIIE